MSGVPEVCAGAATPQIMADRLTLFQPKEAYYAHPGFSDLRPCPPPNPHQCLKVPPVMLIGA